MTTDQMPQEPSGNRLHELLDIDVSTGEWRPSPYGPAMVTRPAKISRQRVLLSYEVRDVLTAIKDIEKSTPKQMPKAIEVLKSKVDSLADRIEEVLISYGDTDPRH